MRAAAQGSGGERKGLSTSGGLGWDGAQPRRWWPRHLPWTLSPSNEEEIFPDFFLFLKESTNTKNYQSITLMRFAPEAPV